MRSKADKSIIKKMEKEIAKGDKSLLDELIRYGNSSGLLSSAQVLKMWNGVSLDTFSDTALMAALNVMKDRLCIDDISNYFRDARMLDDVTGDPVRKNDFLQTIDEKVLANTKSFLRRAGKKIEAHFHKDLCELNDKELMEGLDHMGYTNMRAIYNDLVILKKYLRWCHDAGYFTPAFYEVDKVKPKAVKMSPVKSQFRSPDDLMKYIETVYTMDMNLTPIVAIMLYWMGFNIDEAVSVRVDDVDLAKGTIASGFYGDIVIPEAFIEWIKRYMSSDIIEYTNDMGTRAMYAQPSEYLLKQYVFRNKLSSDGGKCDKGMLKSAVWRVSKVCNEAFDGTVKITSKGVSVSGAMYRLRVQEAREEITDADIVREFRADPDDKIEISLLKRSYEKYKESLGQGG